MLISGYILAGGRNSRMDGRKKLFLEYQGESFCQHILHAFSMFPQTYLSVECMEVYAHLGLPMIEDHYQNIGPMGGIASGLRMIEADALCVAACDMPMIEKSVIEALVKAYQECPQITVVQAGNRLHPLLGIYPKKCLSDLEMLITQGTYKMRLLLEKSGYQVVKLQEDHHSVCNVNTMAEYLDLLK